MTEKRNALRHWLGAGSIRVSHGERLIAATGALFGIAACWGISIQFVGSQSATLISASMGAGAVLLFAVPQGVLSQPWPAMGGQLLSATIGVSCAQWIDTTWLAASVAVGLAILVMHYARCLHPPGGASALVAVIGGADIHALGYNYVLEPVMLNTLTLVIVAMLFNNLLPHRRYPASWGQVMSAPPHSSSSRIQREHLRAAMIDLDMVEDVSEDELLNIIARAETYAAQQSSVKN